MAISRTRVSDLAAELFWRLAERDRYNPATSDVDLSRGRVLFEQPWSGPVMDAVLRPDDDRAAYAKAVAEEALRAIREERNLNGIVYANELAGGRAPTVGRLNVEGVRFAPSAVDVNGPVRKAGRLYLRHPLPACLLVKGPVATGEVLQVADTELALGFALPMWLMVCEVAAVAADLAVAHGIFSIPVPSTAVSRRWDHLIGNSNRFVTGVNILGAGGCVVSLSARW